MFVDFHCEFFDPDLLKETGFEKIVVKRHFSSVSELEKLKKEIKDKNVVFGAEITASNQGELSRKITEFSKSADIITVHGETPEINRLAVRDKRVHALTHPQSIKNAGIDHSTARVACDNGVALEIQLFQLLHSHGMQKSRLMHSTMNAVRIADKYGMHIIFSTGAKTKWDLRSAQDMVYLAMAFGLEKDAAKRTLSSLPESIISEAKK
ncbi:MAG: hypothetical protein J7K00_00235 [Candidatus Diapherotrites archaeon]|nr:hypothetical protein [Candidatus Diapherotrites archaeon]